MRGMGSPHTTSARAAATAVAVGIVLAAAGCGSGGGGASGGSGPATTSPPASAPATTAAAVSLEDAYRAYQQTDTGCTTVEECQAVMTLRLRAVDQLRDAMKATDPTRYAEPIADVDRADRVAQQYGPDNLGAVGNMQAVMQPIQAAITWYASNR